MTRKFILSSAFMAVCTVSQAQDMKEIFTEMPDSILPLLSRNDRLDCVDFIENGIENTVINALKGQSRLTFLSPSIAKVQLSEQVEVQLNKLNTSTQNDGDYIICMIHSVKANICNSVIKFYNKDWKPLGASQFIKTFQTEDFFPKPEDMDDLQYQNLLNLSEHAFIQAEFTDDSTLNITYRSSNYNDEQYREKVLPYVQPSMTMTWDKTSHRFVNQ